MSSIKRWIRSTLIPPRWQLAATYYYLRFSGSLEHEITLIKDLVKSRGTAIDIGANEGTWSYPLSKEFWKVEAFEPLPDCADFINEAHQKNITVHQVALSSVKGAGELHIPVIGGKPASGYATFGEVDGEYETVSIPVHRLDDYAFSSVDFIKIDVEGHELEVLRGAEDTINHGRPVVIVEIEQRHLKFPMSQVFDQITGLGYNGYFVQGKEMRPLSDFSYEKHQRPYLDNTFSRDYIHNFIFIPQ